MAKRIRWSKTKIIEEIQKIKCKNAKYAKNNFYALYGAALRYFGNWTNALKESGYDYNDVAICRKRAVEEILNDIRLLENKCSKYNQKHNSYLYSYAIRLFSSWKNAIIAAGFDYAIIKKHKTWTKQGIIDEICDLENKTAGFGQKHHNKLMCAAGIYFGSWENAIIAAGFDYDQIRKSFTNEKILGEILDRFFKKVYKQKTFDWLKYKKKLRLDFYISDYDLAIEYQGEQHYKIIDFSSKHPEKAKEEFIKNKKRDSVKRRLLKKHGIRLIEIKYTEKITEDNIIRILLDNGVELKQ